MACPMIWQYGLSSFWEKDVKLLVGVTKMFSSGDLDHGLVFQKWYQTCSDVGRKLLAGQCLLISIMAIWVVKFLREGCEITRTGEQNVCIRGSGSRLSISKNGSDLRWFGKKTSRRTMSSHFFWPKSAWRLFTKICDWQIGSASNFVSLPWKLGNPCCYNQHLFRIRDLYKEKCSERRRKSHGTTKTRQIADGTHTYIVLNWIWHQKLAKVDLYQFFEFHFSFLLYFCFWRHK